MNVEEFRTHGKEMIDYICGYKEHLEDFRVTPNVQPGYLRPLLPNEAPEEPEEWGSIMKDVDSKIMKGVTHWQHPRFNAYFPSGNSYPSILGDMLSDAIGCIGFSWVSSPACTELETIVLDWFGKAMGLSDQFLSSGKGGGVIQGSASECILTCMLAARAHAISCLKEQTRSNDHNSTYLPKLVAYCSVESHSCVEKAAMISLVNLKILPTDENGSLKADTLDEAIKEDVLNGLVPFFVSITLGSTACTSFDNIDEIGPICKKYKDIWLHVDAAYAGSGFICPELRYLMKGIEYADSYNTNANKWLLTAFDCSTLYVQDRIKLTKGLVVDPLYLQHANSDETIDYRHWQIPLSRRFRSLKLWFVMRKYGISGLRAYIRNHIKLAKLFAKYVSRDKRFNVMNNVTLGLVCFRLIGSDNLNQDLINAINESGKLFVIPALVKGKFSIRFCVTAESATEADIDHAWQVVSEIGSIILGIKPRTPEVVVAPQRPFLKQLSRQFSFTRSVSRDVFQRQQSRTSLHDGATPILVPDDNEVFKIPPPPAVVNGTSEEEVFTSIEEETFNSNSANGSQHENSEEDEVFINNSKNNRRHAIGD